MKSAYCLFLTLIFLFSCKERKIGGFYRVTGNPMLTFSIYDDSTYVDHFDMSSSEGKWKRKKDTLILNAKWRDCCIESVKVEKSITNENENCVVLIKLFNDDYPEITWTKLIDKNSDTLYVALSPRDTLFIPKNKKYKTIQILVLNSPNNWAKSKVIEFENADTLIFRYDYMYSPIGYSFRKDEKYIIKNRKKILIPLKVE